MMLDGLDTTICFSSPHALPAPGEALLRHHMPSAGYTTSQLARRTGIPVRRLGKIIHGQSALTAQDALRLGHAFNTSALYWMLLQARHDLHRAESGAAMSPSRPAW